MPDAVNDEALAGEGPAEGPSPLDRPGRLHGPQPGPSAPPRRSVARNATALFGSQFMTFGLGAVVVILVPRVLGPEGVGHLRLASSLWALAAVVISFGLPVFFTKELARHPSHGRPLLRVAFRLQLVLFLLTGAVIGAYSIAVGYDSTLLTVVAITGLATLIQGLANTGRGVLQGVERMDYLAAADVGAKVLFVPSLALLLWWKPDVKVAAAAALVPACASLVFILGAIRRLLEGGTVDVGATRRSFVRSARPYLAVSLSLVAYQQVDVIVISLVADQEAIGWYAAADGIFSSLLFVPVLAVAAFFPYLTRTHAADPAASPVLLRRGVGYLALLGLPLGAGVAVVAEAFAVQALGADFEGAGPVLAVFGLVLILTNFTVLFGQFAIAVDRQVLWTKLMALVAVATIGLDLFLVPLTDRSLGNGALGGAAAYLVTEAFLVAVGARVLVPRLLDRPLRIRLVKCAVATALMTVASWWALHLGLAAAIAAGASAYVVALLCLRVLEPAERTLLKDLFMRQVAGRRPFRRSLPAGTEFPGA